jgi:outer membrane receptor for ferrienterochelin and colicins
MKVKQYQKASFLLMVMLFCISLVSAQTTITGTISNQDYEPIIGANIIIKGTAAGTASDLDGKFSLTSKQALPWDLVFSYTGYKSKTVSVTKANQLISVVLELGTSLDEIIISASRKAEKIQDAPASVSVVTAKEIKNQTVANPISLLESTVGVSIDKQGAGRTNITMRGGSDLLSTSVFVMMDYRSLIGSGLNSFDANATTLLPIDVDRIEVVRGPGSALYGPGVTSGVVHFLTKDPFKYQGGTFEVSAGNLNTLKSNFRYADHNENKTFGYKLTAFTSKSDEWGLDPTNETDAATLATFQNDIVDPIDGRLVGQTGGNLNEKGKSYGGSATLYFRPGNSGLNIVTTSGFNYTEGLYWSSQGEGYQAATDFYTQGRVSYKGLFAQAYYNSNKGSNDDAKKGFLYRTGNLSIVDRDQFEGQLQYNFDLESIKTNVTFGADYRAARFETKGRTFGRFEDDDNYDLYGTYLQTKTNLSDKLDLVLAARYDQFSGIDESSFAPRLALVYKANDDHTFRASYNTAFAPNSALDLFIDQPIGNAGAFDLWLHGNSVEQTFNNPQTTFLNGLPTTAGIGIGVGDAYNAFTPAVIQSISAIPDFQAVLPFLLPILQSEGFANAIATNGGFSDGVTIDVNGNLMTPEGTPKSTLREENTFEIGYVGKITNKLKASLDVYRVNKKNFTGIRQISPLVVLPTVGADVNAVLIPTLTAAFTAAYSGYLQSLGLDAGTANAMAGQAAAAVVPGVAAVYDGVASAFFNNPDGSPGARGIIQTDQAPEGGLPHLMYGYRNFGEVTYYGADLGLNYDLNENVKLYGNYSWVSQNSFTGEDIGEPGSTDRFDLNFSQNRVRIGGSYEPAIGLQAGLALKYNSEFESTLGVYGGTVDARTLVDMNLGYQLDNGLFFNLSIDNLLGEKYRTFPAMPEIGTQFLATARYTFGGKK